MADTTMATREGRQALTFRAETPPADRHPALVYLARLSEGSRRTMRGSLDRIAGLLSGGRCDHDTLPWAAVRYQHTAAVRAQLAEHYAPATANKMMAALKGTLQEAWRLGWIPAEEYHRAVDLPSVRGSTLPAGRALPPGEIRALFEACVTSGGPVGARDAALLAILYGAGLRRAEAAALDVEAYDAETGALTVRRGKGRKDRVTYLAPSARAAVDAWLEVRGPDAGALLCPVRKGGRIELRPMTPSAIYHRLRRRAKDAGVASFSPHDLRRSFIGDLLDAGADISAVQQLAGHANVQTTTRYDRRGERAKRKAVDLLHVPYAGGAA